MRRRSSRSPRLAYGTYASARIKHMVIIFAHLHRWWHSTGSMSAPVWLSYRWTIAAGKVKPCLYCTPIVIPLPTWNFRRFMTVSSRLDLKTAWWLYLSLNATWLDVIVFNVDWFCSGENLEHSIERPIRISHKSRVYSLPASAKSWNPRFQSSRWWSPSRHFGDCSFIVGSHHSTRNIL